MTITRPQLLDALATALEAQDFARAMWEGGSAARAAADQWSDVDAVVICEDDAVDDVFDTVEAALAKLSPIDLVWRVPQPTWHGHAQRFYRLEDAPAHLFVDLVVMKKSDDYQRFLVRERHGEPVVQFDKAGLVEPAAFDVEAHRDKMAAELADLKVRFDMLQCLVEKELERGRALDAMNYYLGLTLGPLMRVLGMRYRPERYDFGRRYTQEDFPAEVAREIEALHFVSDAEELGTKHEHAVELFWQVVEDLWT